MTTCQHIDSLVSAFLEHEASPAEVHFIEDHLPTCSRCRAQIQDVNHVLENLSRLPRVETRAEFTDEVLARTHGLGPVGIESREPWFIAPRTSRVLRWGVPLAAAAALVLALVTLQVARRTGEPETAPRDTTIQTANPAVQ